MNLQLLSAFLQLSPSLIPLIGSIEQAIPAPKSGAFKLETFNKIVLGIFSSANLVGTALQTESASNNSAQLTDLSTIFANSIVAGINSSKLPTPSTVGIIEIPNKSALAS